LVKKRIISRTTSASERSRKYPSMLKTEITTHDLDDISSELIKRHNLGYDVDALVAEVKQDALSFLDSREVPYSDLPLGHQGIVPPGWLEKFDHIPGVRPAFGILFEIHCFELKREDKPNEAYAHLLRIVPRQSQLTVANMEARYFAGAARAGDGGKQSERKVRQNKYFCEYCNLRNDGKTKTHARQFAAKRVDISMTTAKRYFKIDDIEKLYQQIS
jgi:hypothetical protein